MHLVELSLLYFTDVKKWRSHLGRFMSKNGDRIWEDLTQCLMP
ncbi:hypothetical protein [Nostoc sp. 'Peltigera membranacea cyanobiont' 232]|nr:hypothetical protein [Nostoc sp. 'Peltigera membranacea cyanobiont' 232]